MKDIRKFICYNQKQIIKFEYEISQLHKIFRKSIDKKNTIGTTDKHYKNLVVDSFNLLQEIFNENSKMITKMYNNDIRITIKMINDTKVIDIYRNSKSKLFNEADINENSGFNSIMTNEADYFISDDLEDDFRAGKYYNKRLNAKLVEDLNKDNINWEECWLDHDGKIDKDNIYNSTLIIPMSISNTNVKKDSLFYKQFFEKKTDAITRTATDIDDIEKIKTIFGFFCIDSKKKNLFQDIGTEKSEDLGFIITDMLSLYLVFFYNYTSGSEMVREFINDKIKKDKL